VANGCEQRSASFSVSFAELAEANPGCALRRMMPGPGYSVACFSAAHRVCMARGCYGAGIGLNEAWSDATVTCLVREGAVVLGTDYATLRRNHPDCDGRSERFGALCNRAINGYCERERPGSVGFGPVEVDGDRVSVVCVLETSVDRYQTTYAVLAVAHPDCNGVFSRFGPQCHAAIHRFCMTRLQRSGFGPIYDEGDRVTIACVRP
jgi:hypothetical protein